MDTSRDWHALRKRTFEVIEIGSHSDLPSRLYDLFNFFTILINLTVTILYTFDGMELHYGPLLLTIEAATVACFAVDYVLRLLTAQFLYPKLSHCKAILKYLFSFNGIVDTFSVLPYYLPFFFPAGMAAFRMFRVMRIFRLFWIDSYYDSFNLIVHVLYSKRQQLLSSVLIILVLMIASSLCLYSLEHDAQPLVFSNAFSGIWWSASTLLTVGYGDIYPITTLGRVFAIIISFLGVGLVAIPTGIISAGFVDQYSRIKRISEYAREMDIPFIRVQIAPRDHWVKKAVRELELPQGILVAAIQRGKEVLAPRGDVTILPGDILVMAADAAEEDHYVDMKEVHLRRQHEWTGQLIENLDISRQTFVVIVKRKNKLLIPHGNMRLLEGDRVILYTKPHPAQEHSAHK